MADLTIADVRAKFPQYSDLTDQQLADAIHQKHYSDIDRTEFYARIGFSPAGQGSAPETSQRPATRPQPNGPEALPGLIEALEFPVPPQAPPDPRQTPVLAAPDAPQGIPSLPGDVLLSAMQPPAPPQMPVPPVVPAQTAAPQAPAPTRQIGTSRREARTGGVDRGNGRQPAPEPAQPDPFANEPLLDLLARRGQQFARGATEVVAAVPEGLAISGAGNPNAAALVGQQEADRAREQKELALQRLADFPEMPVEQRQRIEAVIAESDRVINSMQGLADLADGPLDTPAADRPLFQRGDQIREASANTFGTPDPRDQSFWAAVAEGGGNMSAMVLTSLAATAAGGPFTGLAVGAGQGSTLNQSSLYREALQTGADEETAREAARWGALIGASEIVPINRALKLLPPRLRGEISNRFMRRFADIAQGAGEEAAQEYLATVANNIVAQKIYDPERGWLDGATESALVGAILGGGVGAIGTLAERGESGTAQQPPAAVPAPAQPQAPVPPTAPAQPPAALDPAQIALENIRKFATGLDGAAIQPGSRAETQMKELEAAARRAAATDQAIEDAFALRGQYAPAPETAAPDPLAAAMTPPDVSRETPAQPEQPAAPETPDDALAAAMQPAPAPAPEASPEPAPAPAPETAAPQNAQNAQNDGSGRYEVMDEVETVNGESIPTGRKVRVDLQTGQVSPVETDAPASASQREAVQSQPQTEPLTGASGPSGAGSTDGTPTEPVGQSQDRPQIDRAPAAQNPREVAVTPAGREVEVEYAVVEADSLIPSNLDDGRVNPQFPQTLQPRDRTRPASQEQVRNIARNLDARLLGRSPSTTDGAPIIAPDGVVESGNGRVMGIRQAYQQNPEGAQRYRQTLADQGYDVGRFRNPVLVRVRQTDMNPEDLAAYTRESNERTTSSMSATERAMTDAKAMPDNILPLYRGGDLDSAQNRDFVRQFIRATVSDADAAQMIDRSGQMSQEAVRRVQGALLARAYGDAELVAALIEASDNNIKAIGGALTDVAAQWAQLRAEARSGQIAAEMDQTAALLEAVRIVNRARTSGRNIAEFVGQGDLLSGGDSISEMGKDFLSLFFRDVKQWTRPAGRDKIADAMRFYIEEAQKAAPGADMFGTTADPAGVVRASKERQYGDQNDQASLFGQAPAGDGAGVRPDRDGQGPDTGRTDPSADTGDGDATARGSRQEGDSGQVSRPKPETPETDQPEGTAGTFVARSPVPDRHPYKDRHDELPDRIAPEKLASEAKRLVLEPGKRDGIEYLMMIDADGQIVAYGSGHATGTGPAGALSLALDPTERIVAHHNHPQSNGLSPGDYSLAMLPGMYTVYAHGHDGSVFAVRSTAKGRTAWGPPSNQQTMRILDDLNNASTNLWNKSARHISRLVDAGYYPDEGLKNDEGTPLYFQPGRDRSFALMLAMREAGLIEFDVTGPAAERFDDRANPFLFDQELKKLYDNLVRGLKKISADADPEKTDDRSTDARRHLGDLEGAFGTSAGDRESGRDDKGDDQGREKRDPDQGKPEPVKTEDPAEADSDADFDGALDDMFDSDGDGEATAEPVRTPWAESKPGDLVGDGVYVVARNIKNKSVAEQLAKAVGGSLSLDGAKSESHAVIREEPITAEEANAQLERVKKAYENARDGRKDTRTRRAKADIAKDMQNILRGLKEDGDLFGDTPQPSRTMTQEQRAELEARARQSKMRSGRPQQEAGPLFDTQTDLFGFDEDVAQATPDLLDVLENTTVGAGEWTSGPGGMLTNPHTRGGIIDKAIASGEWFIVFGNGWPSVDGFPTRGHAVAEFSRSIKAQTDPTKYAKLTPLFVEALDGTDVKAALAQSGRRQVFGAMMRPLVDAGLTRDDVKALQPYFTRFLDDVESGRVDLEGDQDASGTGSDLEPDRGDTDAGDDVGGTDVPAAAGRSGSGTSGRRGTADGTSGQREGSGSVSDGDAAGVGTRGDRGVSGGKRDAGKPANDRDGAGSRDRGEQRLPDDAGRAEDTARYASDSPDLSDRRAAQAAADKIKVKPADPENIAKTLPLLLPEQRDDVRKVEERFAKPDGHGMLLTNGTGTGKTYSGGGVIKRFTQQGKDSILILAPSQGILDAWIGMGADMGIPISKLEDTKSAGKGVVATTYANAAENKALAEREWDLVVPDESHKLSQNAEGDPTGALETLRAITNRPKDLFTKARMLLSDDWAKVDAMPDGDAKTAALRAVWDKTNAKAKELAGKERSKVLFLSATPFAYDKTVDYAEGYLFEYGADGVTDSGSRQDGRNLFMVENFGYRIRYHKLTKPEAAVDTGVFERQFHQRLTREGVLSGRSLDIDADYDRRFVRITSADGEKIDAAMSLIRKRSGNSIEGRKWQELQKHVTRNFTYLRRMQLLEAIKAKEAVADIQAHLDLGRKVVVFHDYNKGGGFNPFTGSDVVIPTVGAVEGYKLLLKEMPEVRDLNFSGLGSPLETMTEAFGARARVYNGTVSQKDRMAAKDAFNKDGSGVDVLVVQSAAGEAGISLHDTTGGHQRVLVNLGMPVRPTTTLQEEGRIRRVGSVSDAVFRYYTTGTTWEREAFANKIAQKSGTVENLALGDQARAIREAFINAYMDAGDYPASPEDGKGGRDADRATASTSPYDEAKTHYFARTKNTRSRDQRQGIDFYATPEPLGMKMAGWAKLRTYERVLEPSAGDGAIARYLPGDADRTIIEPSSDLLSKAMLRAPGARSESTRFEDHNIVNKYDAVVMNPPFGSGGKTAYEHVRKAMRHVRPGGRIVALVPTGPAADKQFEKMMADLGPDLVDWNWTADVALPAVTFEKAGTGVRTRVLILDRVGKNGEKSDMPKRINLTGADSIGDFFDRLEDIDVPDRPATVEPAVETETVVSPPMSDAEGFDSFEFFHTKTGKNKYGVQVVRNLGDRFKDAAALAKSHGGYYSRFQDKASGAKRGFLFDTDAQRKAFIEDMQKPQMGFEEIAYHGTPHRFDRFSTDAIGTGEGAQTFGWGLYFAGKREVAEHYKKQVTQRRSTVSVDGKTYSSATGSFADATAEQRAASKAHRLLSEGASMSDVVRSAYHDVRRAESGDLTTFQREGGWGDVAKLRDVLAVLQEWQAADVKPVKGTMYTVDIPDATDLMDWEAPLSEQPKKVKVAIASLDGAPDPSSWDNVTGRDLYEQLLIEEMGDDAFTAKGPERRAIRAAAQKPVSLALREAGIPGHRFWDGMSRQGEGDTYNYVIYDDSRVQVLGFEEAAGGYREASRRSAVFRTEMRGYRRGDSKLTLSMSSGGRKTGFIDYSTFEGDIRIDMIYVDPDHRRRGVATELLQRLQRKHPDKEIDWGYTTPEGTRLYEATSFRTIAGPGAGLDRLIAEKSKRIAELEKVVRDGWPQKGDPIPDRISEAMDEIINLESEVRQAEDDLEFLPATQRLIAEPAIPFDSLRAELDRLNLKRVKLDRDNDPDRQGAFHADVDGALEILIGPSLDPEATLYHESIHAMRTMRLFTPQEWQVLEAKSAKTWVEQYDIPARYPDLLPSEQIEEGIAEAFAEAAKSRTAPKGSIIIRAFNKIARLIKAIGNALRGAGFQTAEDVFGRALAGEIGARDAGSRSTVALLREQRPRFAKRQTAHQRAMTATSLGATGGYAHIPDRRIWEELSASNASIMQRLAGGKDAAMDWVDKARVRLQDRFLPVLRAQQAVEAQNGRPLADDHNAYLTEETFSGKVGRHLFEIDEDYTKRIIAIVAGGKREKMLDINAVGTWLYARHAVERNARIASINPTMPDGGSGMTDAEAKQILATAAAGPDHGRLLQIGKLIDDLRERTLKLREDAGLITAQEADLWRNQYQHYVPLKGFADTDHSEAMLDITGTGRRYNTRGPETKRALGRRSEAFNPLQAAITQAQEVAIRAEKNRVGQALYRLAKDNPSPKLWEVKTPKQTRFYNRSTGLVETRVEDPVSLFMDPNEIAVKVNGQEKRILFKDVRLAQAAGTVGADQMGAITRMMSMFGRYFSSINTMLNPIFTVVNGIRDMITAQITIGHFGGDDAGRIRKAMIKNWPKAWLAAYRGQLNKADSEWTKYYKEYEQAGAKVAFWRIEQPEAEETNLKRRVRDIGAGPARRSLKYLRFSTRENPVLGFVERTNLAVDNAIRLAAFVEARKAGWSVQKAASLSKNMTVNFNRRGTLGSGINAWYVFANAAIQGSHTLIRSMKSKQVRRIVLSLVVLSALQDMVNAALSEEDEDGELAYDKIPMWKSQMNAILMTSAFGGDGGAALTAPMPYGYNLFTFGGQQIGKVMRGVKDPSDAFADTAMTAFTAFSPISGSTTYSMIMPTALDPISEMAMNEDWLGRPIRPEYPYSDYGPDAYKFYRGASQASRAIADTMNRWTGGTIAEAGFVDVSPEYIDHAFGFLTGGAGRFVGQMGDLTVKVLRGDWESIEQRDIPFANRVYYETGDWLDRERYYRFREHVREARAAVRTYEAAGLPVPVDIRRTAALYDASQDVERNLRRVRDRTETVLANENLSAAERDKAVNRIEEASGSVYIQFNRQYLRVHGPQGE